MRYTFPKWAFPELFVIKLVSTCRRWVLCFSLLAFSDLMLSLCVCVLCWARSMYAYIRCRARATEHSITKLYTIRLGKCARYFPFLRENYPTINSKWVKIGTSLPLNYLIDIINHFIFIAAKCIHKYTHALCAPWQWVKWNTCHLPQCHRKLDYHWNQLSCLSLNSHWNYQPLAKVVSSLNRLEST